MNNTITQEALATILVDSAFEKMAEVNKTDVATVKQALTVGNEVAWAQFNKLMKAGMNAAGSVSGVQLV